MQLLGKRNLFRVHGKTEAHESHSGFASPLEAKLGVRRQSEQNEQKYSYIEE